WHIRCGRGDHAGGHPTGGGPGGRGREPRGPGRGLLESPRFPPAGLRHPLDRQFLAHAVSALLTVAVLLLFAVLLLRAPATDPEPATEDGRLEVRFTLRPGQAVVPRLPTVQADREVAQAPASRGSLTPAAS